MPEKKIQLAKHKRIATGLFIAMAVVYLAMVFGIKYYQAPWMGYVKAFAEAAMVGALADWFAVTALFKHPMGLKIPHTNIIENSKNTIGDNLGEFVTDNFLTSQNIRPYITKIDLASLLGNWLIVQKNQELIEKEVCLLARKILLDLDQEKIINFLQNKAQGALEQVDFQAILSQGLVYALEKQEHNRLINVILPKVQIYVQQNKEQIYQAVIEKKPILGLIGGKAVTSQLIAGILTFLEDIAQQPEHKIRQEITIRLEELALEIQNSPQWKDKLEQLVAQFISPSTLRKYMEDFWYSSQEVLLEQLDNKQGALRSYFTTSLNQVAKDLQSEEQLQQKINNWVQQTVYRLALKNTKEVSTLIKNTVEKWDGRELSDKLELEVGKDLQFIRINGTIVGGLVGLLIYIITTLII